MPSSGVQFVGREPELSQLQRMLRAKTARLVVIKGRRRIGKSRLITEFAKDFKYYRFVGLAPDKDTTAQSQRDHFAFQINQKMGLPEIKTDDWNDLFLLLRESVKAGRVILVLDEITWMGSMDSSFLGKLHYAWEEYFQKNNELILILCGSVSSWIEKNILSSTGYFGRVSLAITLDELSIPLCNQLFNQIGFKGSVREKLLLLSVMGGIPWYIEQTDPAGSALETIKSLCFTKDGLLLSEFKYIFHDLFSDKRTDIHQRIVELLANSPVEYDKLSEMLQYSGSGALSDYVEELILSGFITRDYTWTLKTHSTSKLSRLRLSDNYLRFYLKYMESRKSQIERNKFIDVNITFLPGWNTVMGLQFENLILNNRALLHAQLRINPDHIVQDNPFYQRTTNVQKGCQIDYLIQTSFNTLYVCEIRFSTNTIGIDTVREVKEKINRISLPRGYSCIPVLIHASEVSLDLYDSGYFVHIVNVCQWLT